MAIDADWKQIQALFLQGVRVCDLAKRFGVKDATIVTHAKRGGWYAARKTTRIINEHAENPATAAVAELAMIVTHEAGQDLSKRATALRERLARDCERSAAKLETMAAHDLESMELRERTAKMLTDRAMRVFGMEDKAIGKVVMMGLAARVMALTSDPKPAIELPEHST